MSGDFYKVLVVDDDIEICNMIEMFLLRERFQVVKAYDGEDALEKFMKEMPDIVILDIMLPKIDGYDVCREIKKVSEVPIIMLTAKGETFDKVLGLRLGADDYMVKPFEPEELIARIRAVLRRVNPKEYNSRDKVILPSLMVDMDEFSIKVNDQIMSLPKKEMELIYFLVSNPNKLFTRDQLIEQIWGYDFVGETRTVDVHIKRLREKLKGVEDKYEIKTVWGVGYKFEVKKGV
ncbi:putative transcriptional regulatory protein yclJ [Proteiniborus sp. DW1]|uniref:response regulator transcription factor n=1 Tax=Proteiniborus sp. DW1 TaxID=1889883 RepID=UPI00092E0E27|nr:response regulator transcription factor [Proteiniborus sp. DW1]SCG82304.1 putative transcriptional regulatory protein yclJ [Proteiniborus sp. DW1]